MIIVISNAFIICFMFVVLLAYFDFIRLSNFGEQLRKRISKSTFLALFFIATAYNFFEIAEQLQFF